MIIEVILLAIMLAGVVVKWLTTVSIRDRHSKLAEANEDYWRGKNRHKALVSDIAMADHEIGRVQRKIRAAEHRLARMAKEQGVLQKDAKSRATIEAEKARLAEEIRKKRDGD